MSRPGVVFGVAGHGGVAHDSLQVGEAVDLGKATPLTPRVVAGDAVLTATLEHVQVWSLTQFYSDCFSIIFAKEMCF